MSLRAELSGVEDFEVISFVEPITEDILALSYIKRVISLNDADRKYPALSASCIAIEIAASLIEETHEQIEYTVNGSFIFNSVIVAVAEAQIAPRKLLMQIRSLKTEEVLSAFKNYFKKSALGEEESNLTYNGAEARCPAFFTGLRELMVVMERKGYNEEQVISAMHGYLSSITILDSIAEKREFSKLGLGE